MLPRTVSFDASELPTNNMMPPLNKTIAEMSWVERISWLETYLTNLQRSGEEKNAAEIERCTRVLERTRKAAVAWSRRKKCAKAQK
jgi:hypothetical protein